jgi:REP element-mobilizing transposase RayT
MDHLFMDTRREIEQTQNRLPHWEQDGKTYFITFHLADSIAQELVSRWAVERAAWMRFHPEPWTPEQESEFHALFSRREEEWLDAGYGSCILRERLARDVLVKSLLKFDGERYRMWSFVVMPNHAHLLVSLASGVVLARVVQGWKGVSSRRIRECVAISNRAIWQKDYFDRLIRDSGHFWNVARYIRGNPGKAHLISEHFALHETEEVRRVLG